MYKFIFIHDKELEDKLRSMIEEVLRSRLGYDLSQSEFNGILESCLEQVDEVFDIDY